MQIGMIGLGRMGGNMARRLLRASHACVVFDRNAGIVQSLAADGATAAASVDELVRALAQPRHVWVMVPAGAPTEAVIAELGDKLAAGDTIIDGGNTFFKDDIRRAQALAAKQIHYVDAGTSGGVYGLERGYCLMIGGDAGVVRRLDPIFRSLAPGRDSAARTPGRTGGGTAEDGYLHCGPVGSGHFVKMVHNGIEYGIMQALAEGFDIMRGADDAYRMPIPVHEVAELWRRGSVLSSWLIDLTAKALLEDPTLAAFSGHVEDSGEGRWTVMTAVEAAVPADVITAALYTRFRSRQGSSFAEKLLSAMRYQFGGHVERPTGG